MTALPCVGDRGSYLLTVSSCTGLRPRSIVLPVSRNSVCKYTYTAGDQGRRHAQPPCAAMYSHVRVLGISASRAGAYSLNLGLARSHFLYIHCCCSGGGGGGDVCVCVCVCVCVSVCVCVVCVCVCGGGWGAERSSTGSTRRSPSRSPSWSPPRNMAHAAHAAHIGRVPDRGGDTGRGVLPLIQFQIGPPSRRDDGVDEVSLVERH